jgi:hypothetical protein
MRDLILPDKVSREFLNKKEAKAETLFASSVKVSEPLLTLLTSVQIVFAFLNCPRRYSLAASFA